MWLRDIVQYATGGGRAVAFVLRAYKLYTVLMLFVPALLRYLLTIETKWRQWADICMAVITDEERWQEGKRWQDPAVLPKQKLTITLTCNFYIETNNASIMPWYWRACQHSGSKRGMMCNNRAHNGMFLILPSHPFYTDVSSALFRPARYAKNLQCAKTLFNIVMVIWLKINKYWMPIIRSSLLPLHQIDTNLSEGIWRLAGGSCDWPNGVNAWPIYPWLHLIGEMFTFWTFVPYLNAWCVWQSFKHDVFIAHVHITITMKIEFIGQLLLVLPLPA